MQEEWIDLCREDRNRRVQLLPGGIRSGWPPPPPAPTAPAAPAAAAAQAAAGAQAATAGPSAAAAPRGAAAVGRRVGIWWEGDSCFYYGTVSHQCVEIWGPLNSGAGTLSFAGFALLGGPCPVYLAPGSTSPATAPSSQPKQGKQHPRSLASVRLPLCGRSEAFFLPPVDAPSAPNEPPLYDSPYPGQQCMQVVEFRPETGRYQLRYDDGDTDWVNLEAERLDWGGGAWRSRS